MTSFLIDGAPANNVPADDRGFLYGDGVFETMAFRGGKVALWTYHMARLSDSCRRLQLDCPAEEVLLEDLLQVTRDNENCVLRLTLSRVSATPGYGFTPGGGCRRVWATRPLPEARTSGLRVGLCQSHLSRNPDLAGMKHLSRIEQVMAAGEVAACGWDEGLMLDVEGLVIEATNGNLLFRAQGRWFTPPLDLCGVSGVARACLKDHFQIESIDLPRVVLDQADALAICNAVRGVEAVSEVIGVKEYDVEPVRALTTDAVPCVID